MSIRLTQYSHGAGCGCKLSPKVLDQILHGIHTAPDDKILVGNDAKDDAAAYDLGDGRALISTTDFFMPIVDDPFTFGQVAAANSLSDESRPFALDLRPNYGSGSARRLLASVCHRSRLRSERSELGATRQRRLFAGLHQQ